MMNSADSDPLAPRTSTPGDGAPAPDPAPGAERAPDGEPLSDPDAPIVERRARPGSDDTVAR